ncbi:MAG: SDR family oxidoreductase [Propionicimonas sp.]|uniref:SDR family oxidoreductase n=1 Tax=Propionicimonas sp. TaxID=1955623 RepID=UPI003D0AD408
MASHLITGAGSGIGAAVAELLAARGDDLVLVARTSARAADLATAFPVAQTLVADLADPNLEDLLAALDGAPERLDSVVNVAGNTELDPVADLTAGSFLDTLAVNLVGPVALTRWALPALRAGRGTVVFVNSTAALTVNPRWGAYAAAKAGLRAIADALRAEEAANGVRVTSVFPSRTATPLQHHVRDQEGGAYDPSRYMDPRTVAAQVVAAIDLPPDASVAEVVLRPPQR